jgi:hypothetical protein
MLEQITLLTRSLPSGKVSAFRREPHINDINPRHLADLRICSRIEHFDAK